MAMMSRVELPLYALRAQISSAIDIVVQMSRHIGGQRRVTQISEIESMVEVGQYRLRDVFNLKQVEHTKAGKDLQLVWAGERSAMAGNLRPEQQARITNLTRPIFAVDNEPQDDKIEENPKSDG